MLDRPRNASAVKKITLNELKKLFQFKNVILIQRKANKKKFSFFVVETKFDTVFTP